MDCMDTWRLLGSINTCTSDLATINVEEEAMVLAFFKLFDGSPIRQFAMPNHFFIPFKKLEDLKELKM